jgi:copper homeostasis protein CutC
MELAALCLDLDYKLADGPRSLTRYQITFLMAALQTRNEAAEMQQLASQGITRIVFRGEEDEEEDRGE